MTDQDVRDFLERMAVDEPLPFFDAEPLTRRARRRAARTVVVGAVGIAAAVAVLFAGLAEIRTAPALVPAVQTTQTPTGPFTERFDSPRHGLSVSYPSGWQTRAASEPWGHAVPTFGATDVDVIFDPTHQDDLYIALVSEPLDGQPPAGWCCSPQIQGPDLCYEGGGGGGGGSYMLDGAVDGFASSIGCGGGGVRHSVVAATAARGYIIQLYVGNDRLAETYDWDWLEGLLETVDLRPEEALDASDAPASQ